MSYYLRVDQIGIFLCGILMLSLRIESDSFSCLLDLRLSTCLFSISWFSTFKTILKGSFRMREFEPLTFWSKIHANYRKVMFVLARQYYV